ncbi:MAG: hypothetical protein AAGC56_06330 [Pseudomonadota bacterium]
MTVPHSAVLFLAASASVVLASSPARAQNTGGVFGPVVRDGHAAAEYRIGIDPDGERITQRLHYEQAFSGALMGRVVVQTRSADGAPTDFDYVQGELFVQLNADDAPWRHGLRFDVRVRDDGRPGFVSTDYMNEFNPADGLEIRTVVLATVEYGTAARDGVVLETRNHLAADVAPGLRLGVETFNAYGTTADFQRMRRQRHQIGPFAFISGGAGWRVFVGGLFGLTEGSPDVNARFWLTKSF